MYHSDVSRPMERSDEYCTTIVLRSIKLWWGREMAMAMEMGVMAMATEMEMMETIMDSMTVNGLYPH